MQSKDRYENGVSKAKNPDNIVYTYDELKNDVTESYAFEEFLEERISFEDSSKRAYINNVTNFCFFHQEKIDDLIKEYKDDQKNEHENDKSYRVRKDLIQFARHQVENKQAKTTILNKQNRMKTFLKENGVFIPKFKIDLSKYEDNDGYYTKKDFIINCGQIPRWDI